MWASDAIAALYSRLGGANHCVVGLTTRTGKKGAALRAIPSSTDFIESGRYVFRCGRARKILTPCCTSRCLFCENMCVVAPRRGEEMGSPEDAAVTGNHAVDSAFSFSLVM